MLICPKCGSVAEHDGAGNIVCTCQSCNWSARIDKINKTTNNLIQPNEVGEKIETKINEINGNVPSADEINSNSTLRYYYVEYVIGDSELVQGTCVYDFIAKRLKEEGELTPFVERCYQSFLNASDSEIVQFYNHFGLYSIYKVVEFENLNVVYEKRNKSVNTD